MISVGASICMCLYARMQHTKNRELNDLIFSKLNSTSAGEN